MLRASRPSLALCVRPLPAFSRHVAILSSSISSGHRVRRARSAFQCPSLVRHTRVPLAACAVALRFCSTGGAGGPRGEGQMEHHLTRYSVPAETGRIRACPRMMAASVGGAPASPSSNLYTSSRNLIKSFPPAFIRNVSVVAHVDHGKTTLTDALLRRAGLLPADGATGTFTDRLSVEKDRGITIKAQTCSVFLSAPRAEGAASANPDPADPGRDVYLLNLIDTPGHVDFQYEVSRSLGASEGALLLVDVSQGVEAQTMAQFYASLEHELAIVPVLTKLDQVLSDDVVDRALAQLEDSTGLLRQEAVLTSAKAKLGMEAVYAAVIDHVPSPASSASASKGGRLGFSDLCQLPPMHPDSEEKRAAEASLVPLRALLFDCWTEESSGMRAAATGDGSKPASGPGAAPGAAAPAEGAAAPQKGGIYCLVRVMDGTVTRGTAVTFYHSGKRVEVQEVGILHPSLYPTAALTAGMVGYLFFAGLTKADVLIGDTLCTVPTKKHSLARLARGADSPSSNNATSAGDAASGSASDALVIQPVPGFKTVQPVVFGGFYPDEGEYIRQLRDAVDLLCVNDPSVTVESIQCQALGPGLQLGFLGLLHMQVFKERLLAEFGQSVLVTPPQVQYMCVETGMDASDTAQRKALSVNNWRWPHEGVSVYLEPFVVATVVTPKEYFSPINSAALAQFRGEQMDMRVIDDARMLVRYRMPLADLARGFFPVVKSSSHGYATLDYDEPAYEPADLVKVDIVINKAKITALSLICPRHEADTQGRRILASLKGNLTRSSVDLPLQAVLGNKVIARDTIRAYRKDVTAKIHAGDISRKRKKWDDQKKGKERMARRSFGTVTLDQKVLAAAMGASTM